MEEESIGTYCREVMMDKLIISVFANGKAKKRSFEKHESCDAHLYFNKKEFFDVFVERELNRKEVRKITLEKK